LYKTLALTKEEHIKYWADSAIDNWDTVEYLFKGGKNMEALFFAHLVLEKLAKALWVKNNGSNYPPKIHGIVKILEAANIQVDMERKSFLIIVNDFQLEGRYADYKEALRIKFTKEKTNNALVDINTQKEWLLSLLY
jgi:HEPN domain-containing protein